VEKIQRDPETNKHHREHAKSQRWPVRKRASLNLSLNIQIKVESVKYTIFEVISPHRKGLDTIGVI
jgi:hypothetical protein